MQLPLFAGSRQQIAITTIRMTQTANSTGTPVSVRLCVSVSVGKKPLNFKFLLLVIFAEESYFCNALLQKRPGASVCLCNACELNAQRSRVGGSRTSLFHVSGAKEPYFCHESPTFLDSLTKETIVVSVVCFHHLHTECSQESFVFTHIFITLDSTPWILNIFLNICCIYSCAHACIACMHAECTNTFPFPAHLECKVPCSMNAYPPSFSLAHWHCKAQVSSSVNARPSPSYCPPASLPHPSSLHFPSPSYRPPTIPSLFASLHSLLLRIRESGSCPILLDMGLHCVSVCMFALVPFPLHFRTPAH